MSHPALRSCARLGLAAAGRAAGPLGLRLRIAPADIDETPRPDETPGRLRPADGRREVRGRGRRRLGGEPAALPVLAADTIVVLDRRILGKPAGAEEAARHAAAGWPAAATR